MKNKKIIMYGLLIVVMTLGIFFLGLKNEHEIIKSKNEKEKISNETISMMYETEVGSGEYQTVTDSKWKIEGYVFNEKLSKCENGGMLSWNKINNVVFFEGNKSDKCYVYFDVEQKTLTDYIKSLYISDGINNMYKFDGAGTYTNAIEEINDESIRYAGGDYKLTTNATSAGYSKITASDTSDTGILIDLYCNNSKTIATNYCSTKDPVPYYTVANANDHYGSYEEALEAGVTLGFLTKDNIKNFVCFGSDEKICPENNLYRIIGVFGDNIKLIKANYADSNILGTDGGYKSGNLYAYNKAGGSLGSNNWETSSFNTLNLNTNYLNNIGEKWRNMISESVWNLGQNSWNIGSGSVNNVIAKEFYNYEIKNHTSSSSKIGLMYISDYGYAASPNNWNISLSMYKEVKDENWLYIDGIAQTIGVMNTSDSFPYPSASGAVIMVISATGGVTVSYGNMNIIVRPTFYLLSGTKLNGGNGTKANPYRISL